MQRRSFTATQPPTLGSSSPGGNRRSSESSALNEIPSLVITPSEDDIQSRPRKISSGIVFPLLNSSTNSNTTYGDVIDKQQSGQQLLSISDHHERVPVVTLTSASTGTVLSTQALSNTVSPPISALSPGRSSGRKTAVTVIEPPATSSNRPAASPDRRASAHDSDNAAQVSRKNSIDLELTPSSSMSSVMVPPPPSPAVPERSSSTVSATSLESNPETFNEHEKRYFRKMFDMFDTDHSGAIGFFEMKNLTRHLGVQLSDEHLEKSIREIDANGNGELEFDEFLQWLSVVNDNVGDAGDEFAVLKSKIRAQGARPLSTTQIEQFRQVFKHFDVDGSGTIDVEELGHVFEAMGQQLSTEELQSVLKQADDDGSGEIDFDEFLMLMCSSFGAEKSFEADLIAAFQRYDVDGDGLLSTRDLKQLVLELVGETMTASEVEEVVEVAAMERSDGFVDFLRWESLWDACRGVL